MKWIGAPLIGGVFASFLLELLLYLEVESWCSPREVKAEVNGMATLERDEDHQCKCCSRSPAPAGGPRITSGCNCAGQCGCAGVLRTSSKLFYPLAVARQWVALSGSSSYGKQTGGL